MPRTSSARQSQAPQTPNRATRGWPQINEAIYMTNAPGQCTAGDDESSGAEIPSRKELKKRSAAKQVQEELDEAQDDQGEPEWEVEEILEHRFKKNGGVEYHVKWLGYPDEQNTWEPPSNVDDCAPLDKYHEQIGGPPKPAGKTPARADSKKRKASSSAVDSPTVSGSTSRGAKKAKAESSTTNGGDIKLAKRDSFKPPAGSWENEIISIETMSVGDDNGLYAYIQWKDGHRSQHRNTVVNSKCPQKMLQFYESHLQFNDTTDKTSTKYVAGETSDDLKVSKAEPQAANGASDEVPDDIEDEEMGGVKGVATAV